MERGDGWLRISMEGHAGFGAYGSDPVCGGLSALAYTGARMLEELDAEGKLAEPPLIRLEPGMALLAGRANAEGKEAISYLAKFLMGGFRLMEDSFPTAVSVQDRQEFGSKMKGEMNDEDQHAIIR